MATVLIVEDIPEIADLYLRVLSEHQVYISTDIQHAKNYLMENRPDLTILDFHFPAASGFTLLKYMRSQDKLKDIPVIGISSDDSLIPKAKLQGINAFLMKPIAINDLIKTTQRLLASSGNSVL